MLVNYTVQNLVDVYNNKCSWCTYVVGWDGDILVMVVSDNFSNMPTEIEIMAGPFLLPSNVLDLKSQNR